MLKVVNDKTMEGQYLRFRDEGLMSERSVTHKHSICSKLTGEQLGWVLWKVQWRKFTLFTLAGVYFDATCLKEISEFLELKTDERKEIWEKRKA